MTGPLRRGPDDPASLNLRHHGDDELAPGLVDLAVNVRPGGPPAWLRKVLADSLGSLSVYPTSRAARGRRSRPGTADGSPTRYCSPPARQRRSY